MVNMKKGFFILLLVVAVLAGAAVTPIVLGLSFADIVSGNTAVLSQQQYREYVKTSNRFGKLSMLMDYIERNYYTSVDEEDILVGAYRGAFEGLDDPYSYYMTSEEFEEENMNVAGDYSGIGVTVAISEDYYIYAMSIAIGSPAEKAGIQVGDILEYVNGKSYSYKELSECAANIRGKAGTNVELTVIRDGEELTFNITRAKIEVITVTRKMLDSETGYIRIESFNEGTADDFKSALKDIKAKGAKRFVLDLRNNGGGLVDECVSIADELMNSGIVAYYEDQYGYKEEYKVSGGRTDLEYVVLINGYSASASEILTCGVQDNKEAAVVGTNSYGKGIIQSIDQLTDGSAVKLTVYQYFSPTGNEIHKKGIMPDYIIEDDPQSEADEQLEAALAVLKNEPLPEGVTLKSEMKSDSSEEGAE